MLMMLPLYMSMAFVDCAARRLAMHPCSNSELGSHGISECMSCSFGMDLSHMKSGMVQPTNALHM